LPTNPTKHSKKRLKTTKRRLKEGNSQEYYR